MVGSGTVTPADHCFIITMEPCIRMCGYDDWLAVGVAVRNVLLIESIVYAYTRASVGWNCCVSLLLCTTDTHMGGGGLRSRDHGRMHCRTEYKVSWL